MDRNRFIVVNLVVMGCGRYRSMTTKNWNLSGSYPIDNDHGQDFAGRESQLQPRIGIGRGCNRPITTTSGISG